MSHSPSPDTAPLLSTPLAALHRELGAKMVPFAGYEMPVQYPLGVLKEHLHTRARAGLFDVSHMGQVRLRGDDPAAALEALLPGDLKALKPSRMRYSFFTNDVGGILDDLMITRMDNHLFVVVNAACKTADIAHMRAGLTGVDVEYLGDDRGLLALQGPDAALVLARFIPAVATMPFMSALEADLRGIPVLITRSGYTGEDGYEISVAGQRTEDVARLLLREEEVEAIGLGARDSLRLEAGLCLYGHDIDTTTTPVEARLTWAISKRRREEGGYPGDAVIRRQLADGAARYRVGLLPEGRAPAREHTLIQAPGIQAPDAAALGEITSGGFGPTLGGPIAMGYVAATHASEGTPVDLMVRGKALPAKVAAMPFVPQRYYRG